MDDWKEVSNWEVCKAKGEKIAVQYKINDATWRDHIYGTEDNTDWNFDPCHKYRIKTPDPARLLDKVIWTKDGRDAQILSEFSDSLDYKVSSHMISTVNNFRWMSTSEIEKEFDIKDKTQ